MSRARILIVLCGLLMGSASAAREMPAAAEVPVAGQNLKWCIRGIRCSALGRATDNDLLEAAGGIVAYLTCR